MTADELATSVGIEKRTLKAIMRVESSGRPFGTDGRMIIRFEPHIFRKFTGQTVLLPGMREATSAAGLRRLASGGQAAEYEALARAVVFDEDAAYRSISMGLGQIMGFNHVRCGYTTARAMFDDLSASAEAQKVAMMRFVVSDRRLLKAARERDWTTFARIYNGDASGVYALKIATAYTACVCTG